MVPARHKVKAEGVDSPHRIPELLTRAVREMGDS
jgi:hypothetical protein